VEEASMLQTVVDTLSELPLLPILHAITLFFLLWCVMPSLRVDHRRMQQNTALTLSVLYFTCGVRDLT
jgi:hypothetical protein